MFSRPDFTLTAPYLDHNGSQKKIARQARITETRVPRFWADNGLYCDESSIRRKTGLVELVDADTQLLQELFSNAETITGDLVFPEREPMIVVRDVKLTPPSCGSASSFTTASCNVLLNYEFLVQ